MYRIDPSDAIDARKALPDDLPVDVPESGVVNGVFPPAEGTMQDNWVLRILHPADTSDSLVEFYDQWFANEGIKAEATRNDTKASWREASADSPLMWVSIDFADPYYGGSNRLEVWYAQSDG